MTATTAPARSPVAAPQQTLLRLCLATATVMVPVVLLLLVARRLTGNFSPLPGVMLVLIGAVAALAAIAWRKLCRWSAGEGSWPSQTERGLPAICLALLAIGLSIHGTPPLSLMLFWLVLVAEEVWTGWPRPASPPPHVVAPQMATITTESNIAEEEEEEAPLLPADVSQQMTRVVEGDQELLICLLRATFAAGQQHETLHVAFCPPLLNAPTATCEQLDGPPCEVKLAAVEVYGARLELKRRGPLALADEVILKLQVQ